MHATASGFDTNRVEGLFVALGMLLVLLVEPERSKTCEHAAGDRAA